MTTSTLIKLSVLSDAAVRLMHYQYGHICVLPASRQHRTPVYRGRIPELKGLECGFPDGDLVAFLLINPTSDLESAELSNVVTRLIQASKEGARRGSFDVVACIGGVDLRVHSSQGWLAEPDIDRQSLEDLNKFMKLFSVENPVRGGQEIHMSDIRQARHAWRRSLNSHLAGNPMPLDTHPTALQAGSVRDAVLVWGVGKDGDDYQAPGKPFVPPTYAPDEDRIASAYQLLASRLESAEQGHALACASYLAWWSGHTRLANYLFCEANRHHLTTRLGELVRRALVQKVLPPWMS